jgi:pectate lyase
MAEVNKNVVPLLFFLSFAVIIPTLHAHIAEFDDYWKLRAEQARKDALEAYHPQPEEITNNFNSHVNK